MQGLLRTAAVPDLIVTPRRQCRGSSRGGLLINFSKQTLFFSKVFFFFLNPHADKQKRIFQREINVFDALLFLILILLPCLRQELSPRGFFFIIIIYLFIYFNFFFFLIFQFFSFYKGQEG